MDEFDLVEPLVMNKAGQMCSSPATSVSKILKNGGTKEAAVSLVDLSPERERA